MASAAPPSSDSEAATVPRQRRMLMLDILHYNNKYTYIYIDYRDILEELNLILGSFSECSRGRGSGSAGSAGSSGSGSVPSATASKYPW